MVTLALDAISVNGTYAQRPRMAGAGEGRRQALCASAPPRGGKGKSPWRAGIPRLRGAQKPAVTRAMARVGSETRERTI